MSSGWSLYVDGSYDAPKDLAAFAFAVVRYDMCFYKDTGTVPHEGARNIAAELMAVQKGLNYLLPIIKHDEDVTVYYDYAGIEKWAMGQWTCNHVVAQNYQSYIQNLMHSHSISFVKVKAHSGNPWNDHVDKLAREVVRGGGNQLR